MKTNGALEYPLFLVTERRHREKHSETDENAPRKKLIFFCNCVLPYDQSIMIYDSWRDWKSTISTRRTDYIRKMRVEREEDREIGKNSNREKERDRQDNCGAARADRYKQLYMISRHERNIFQRAVESQKRGTNWDFYYEYPFVRQSNGVFFYLTPSNPPAEVNLAIHFVINGA